MSSTHTCNVHKIIKWVRKQLIKLFSTLFSREKASKYLQPVIDAANNKGYIETFSNKADSLHLDIKNRYEEDIQASFVQVMSKLSYYFGKSKVRLAVDFQEHGFYGKTENMHIIGTAYKKEVYENAFKFITISILTGKKEERIPLYALPWHIGQDLTESVLTLISTVKPWLGKIEIIQFDRGFFSKELIYFLEENKFPYLIHMPCMGKQRKELVRKTKSFYSGKYNGKFCADKTTYNVQSNFYVCKNVDEKHWLFVSSIQFKNKFQVRNLYKNRWQIETNYAVHNSARIMSKSAHYLIRYFYYLVDTLLQVLWRLCASKAAFKTFLFSMVIGVENMLMRKPGFAGVIT